MATRAAAARPNRIFFMGFSLMVEAFRM
jgi:hypothetical protein